MCDLFLQSLENNTKLPEESLEDGLASAPCVSSESDQLISEDPISIKSENEYQNIPPDESTIIKAEVQKYNRVLYLSIAYSATLGGFTTLIGTGEL
jgi:hypothetical protein